MGEPRLVYVPCKDATPERELAALATIYKFVLERHERKKDAETESGEEEGELAPEFSRRIEGIVPEEKS